MYSVEVMAGPGGRGAFPADLETDEHQAKVRHQMDELAKQGTKAEARIVQGGVKNAAHAIADVAKEEGADLIVVGSRGHTSLGGLVLGSVTQRLLHLGPCPYWWCLPRPRDASPIQGHELHTVSQSASAPASRSTLREGAGTRRE
jgi:hypothetical protein